MDRRHDMRACRPMRVGALPLSPDLRIRFHARRLVINLMFLLDGDCGTCRGLDPVYSYMHGVVAYSDVLRDCDVDLV